MLVLAKNLLLAPLCNYAIISAIRGQIAIIQEEYPVMRKRRFNLSLRKLACEQLESRCVLSALAGGDFHAVIVAGDPNGSPADSPANRVDDNNDSWFAGVGSLQISARRGTFLCTGTAIDTTHVLTAGHCVDLNDDGRSDSKDGILSIKFNVNSDTDLPTDLVDIQITAASWRTHPDFTGFNHPSINDDLAVITLASPLPSTVPTYALASSDMVAGSTHLIMVGYGRSGDGVNGYTTNASFTVKRVGENMVDAFYGQDDSGKPAANEVFRFDFDSPDGSNGSLGGPSLGNTTETTLGGGDSGGPSFVLTGSDPHDFHSYTLVGVNTFTQGTTAPLFGSLGGGINVFPYVSWIQNGSGGGGGGGPGHGKGQSASVLSPMDAAVLVASPADSDAESIPSVQSQGYVGAALTLGSPSAPSAGTWDAHPEGPQVDWLVGHLPARAAAAKRDLFDLTEAASGIADPETLDATPAVDAVLHRWSG
jgi:trypsin